MRNPAFDTPDTFLEKVGWKIPGMGLHILRQRDSHGAGLSWIRQYAHGFWKSRQQLFRPLNSIEEATQGPKRIVHAHDRLRSWQPSGFQVYCGPAVDPDDQPALERLSA
jgi:hypothetical protein